MENYTIHVCCSPYIHPDIILKIDLLILFSEIIRMFYSLDAKEKNHQNESILVSVAK